MNIHKLAFAGAILSGVVALSGCSSTLASQDEVREVCTAVAGQNHRDIKNSIKVVNTIKPQIAVIRATNPNEAKTLLDGLSSIESLALSADAEVTTFFIGGFNRTPQEIDDFAASQEEKIDKLGQNFDTVESFCQPFLKKG